MTGCCEKLHSPKRAQSHAQRRPSPSCQPNTLWYTPSPWWPLPGAETEAAALDPVAAAELRAALQDVVAAQRAQQASARGAAPLPRPRLRNSRCAALVMLAAFWRIRALELTSSNVPYSVCHDSAARQSVRLGARDSRQQPARRCCLQLQLRHALVLSAEQPWCCMVCQATAALSSSAAGRSGAAGPGCR